MNEDRLLSEEEMRSFVIQEIAYMVADGIKTGAFMDWTVGNKIADLINTQKRLYAESEKLKELNRVRIEAIGNSRENLIERIVQRMEFCEEELGLPAEQRARIK